MHQEPGLTRRKWHLKTQSMALNTSGKCVRKRVHFSGKEKIDEHLVLLVFARPK
jgi:hypothetical protein